MTVIVAEGDNCADILAQLAVALAPPAAPIEPTEPTALDERNVLDRFLIERTVAQAGHSVTQRKLFDAYREWAIANGYRPYHPKHVARVLGERLTSERTLAGRLYTGLRLKRRPRRT
ncbi:MAG: hypothetical protein ACOY3N_23475 [Bradyrhizobium sp.]|uniref:hypothetical protein n=1 Tax=Bradyrhizobium sp. TaxID=376 RepID=UPI003BF0AB6F